MQEIHYKDFNIFTKVSLQELFEKFQSGSPYDEGHISTTPTEDKCAVVSGASGLQILKDKEELSHR